MQEEICLITSVRFSILLRMLIKGKRFKFYSTNLRICEDQQYDSILDTISEVKDSLEEFDSTWVTYEQLYVVELMLIESDARRFITEAIEIEKEITS